MVHETQSEASISLLKDKEPQLYVNADIEEELGENTSFVSFVMQDNTEVGSCTIDNDLITCYDGMLNHTGQSRYTTDITLPKTTSPADEKACRICQDDEGKLIAPCMCSGSVKWVHRECLDEWRAQSFNSKNFVLCSMCNQSYVFERINQTEQAKKKYRLRILRDFLVLFAVLSLFVGVCVGIAMLVNYFSFPLSQILPENWQQGFNRYFFAFVMGIGLFFAAFGVIAIMMMVFSCCLYCCGATVPEGPSTWFCIYIYW